MQGDRRDAESSRDEDPREEQRRAISKTAKKESWITMLLRKRRESKGKPTRRSPGNRPWFRRNKD